MLNPITGLLEGASPLPVATDNVASTKVVQGDLPAVTQDAANLPPWGDGMLPYSYLLYNTRTNA